MWTCTRCRSTPPQWSPCNKLRRRGRPHRNFPWNDSKRQSRRTDKRPVFMIEIIQEGMVENQTIELCFWYVGHRGNWGFCFPCNDKGKVNVGSLNPTARDRYEKCASGTMRPEIERPVILHHTVINQIGRGWCRDIRQ